MNQFEKTYRFVWRAIRNAVCYFDAGRAWLYPQAVLSSRFGRGDAEYAWRVFLSHYRQLHENGFAGARRVLEVGPGRNLGTALLWWCCLSARQEEPVEIVCWDVFKNAAPEAPEFWSALADELMGQARTADDDLLGGGCSYCSEASLGGQEYSPTVHRIPCHAHGTTDASI
jgi:hypothetical protein